MCVIITYIGDWMMPVHLYAHFHLNEIDRVLCNGMDKKEKQQTKTTNQKQTNGGKKSMSKIFGWKIDFYFSTKKNESKTNQIQL